MAFVKNKFLLFTISVWLGFSTAVGQIKLPEFLGDHMVLQQQSLVELNGSTGTSSSVQVHTSWNGETINAKVDEENNFSVNVQTPKAGGPYEIIFKAGCQTLKLKDILIGEVWVFSGQSNMEMPLKGFHNQPISGADSIILKAENSNLRIFNAVKQVSFLPEKNIKGTWKVSTSEVAKITSALAFQFGDMLQRKLDIPIGVIHSSWGGTPIESWMSRQSLEKEFGMKFEKPDTITSKTPSALYNGMIAPFERQRIRGFIWYQGENNIKAPEQYKQMMAAMVQDWRKKWDGSAEQLPFYFVEIAPWRYPRTHKATAALFREAQREAAETIPNAGMATTIDIGSDKTIHPPDKTTIAERLLKLALAETYDLPKMKQEIPSLASYKIKGNKIFLKFKNGQGLHLRGDSSLFEIAGKDRNFYSAEVQITEKGISVNSKKVDSPVAVRYAFKNYVKGNLYNVHGVPVPSFRTDDWMIIPAK